MVSWKQGLTGLLQSPVRGAEKSGLPGMLSGKLILNLSGTSSLLRITLKLLHLSTVCLAIYGVSGIVLVESLVYRVLIETYQ